MIWQFCLRLSDGIFNVCRAHRIIKIRIFDLQVISKFTGLFVSIYKYHILDPLFWRLLVFLKFCLIEGPLQMCLSTPDVEIFVEFLLLKKDCKHFVGCFKHGIISRVLDKHKRSFVFVFFILSYRS